MNGLVVYHTNYGSTKEYAEYIARKLDFDCCSDNKGAAKKLTDADLVILVSNVRLFKLGIEAFLRDNFANLISKKLFLVTVSGVPAGHKTLDLACETSIPDSIRSKFEIYQFGGKLILKKLGLIDKLMMKIGGTLTKDPEQKILCTQDYDKVDFTKADGLIERVLEAAEVPLVM